MIELCAECMDDPCVCDAIAAADELRALRIRPATMLELAERMAEFDAQWNSYRERCRARMDERDRVEVIRDPRLN